MVIYSFLDPFLKPVVGLPSPWGLLIIAFVLTFIITIFYKYLTDQDLMKNMKLDLKKIQNETKELKDYPQKLMAKQKEAMELNLKFMLQSLKPTLFTLLPILLVFNWLRGYYTNLGNPDILFGLGWFGTYVIFSIVLSIGLRKIMKVH